MKRCLSLILSIVMFVACDSRHRFIVDGVIKNADNGEMICLSYPVKRADVWYSRCDTAYINNGYFRFEGVVDGVVPASFSFQNMDFAHLFLEPSDIKFSAERSALYGYSISGLSIDNELDVYRKAFAEYDKRAYQKLYEAMRKNEAWSEAHSAGSPNADKLWAEFYAKVLEYRTISDKWPTLALDFVRSYPDNSLVPNVVDRLVSCGCDHQLIDSLIMDLSAEQRQSLLGELMTIRREISKLNGGKVGSKAVDFALTSLDGSRVMLSECYAEGYLLLDFWASWCRPCINEIPKVRELRNMFGDRVQIVSVSIDDDTSDWRDAVAQHDLTEWPQMIIDRPDDAEMYYFREQADMPMAYDVQEIPCFMLVDTTGIIVGRWSHITPTTIAEIERLIEEHK